MKYMICVLLILVFVFTTAQIQASEERGLSILKITDRSGEEVGLYKESYALIIGVSKYTEGWPELPGVKEDVQAVKNALEKNGFHVVMAENPNRAELEQAFSDFINRYGQQPDNRLLFYFAGHGHTLKLAYGDEMGYIVPVDAPNPNFDETGFLAKAMDMQMVEVYARRIQAKHALFLFDSCFSGSLFAISRAAPENITYKTAHPVRQFITSGSANEQVPDKSIFRQQFIAALEGEGDNNGDGYVTGAELGEFLQSTVVNYTRGAQHPQYGKIRHPALDKGDFVFVIVINQQNIVYQGTPAAVDTPVPSELDNWEILNGNWSVKNGKIYGSGDEVNGWGHIILKEELRDYVFEVTVERISGPKQGIGIGTRANVIPGGERRFRNNTSDIQGYAFNFTFEKTYNLFNGISGKWYLINTDWKEWQYSELFGENVSNIRIEATGSTITIYINGKKLTGFSDDTHLLGAPYLAVYDPSQILRFSNITVTRK